MNLGAMFMPRWSVSYGITNGSEVSATDTTEEVLIEFPVNPIDFPRAATKISISVSGWYEVTAGQGIFRIRYGGYPVKPTSPVGEVQALLRVEPTLSPTALPTLICTMPMPTVTTLVQITISNSLANGRTTLRAAWAIANAF